MTRPPRRITEYDPDIILMDGETAVFDHKLLDLTVPVSTPLGKEMMSATFSQVLTNLVRERLAEEYRMGGSIRVSTVRKDNDLIYIYLTVMDRKGVPLLVSKPQKIGLSKKEK